MHNIYNVLYNKINSNTNILGFTQHKFHLFPSNKKF